MAVWLNTTFYGLDTWAFTLCNNLSKFAGGILTPLCELFALFGKGGYFFIAFAVILLLFKNTRKAGVSMLFAMLVGLVLTNWTLKPLVSRPRPFTNSEYAGFWEQVGSHFEKSKSFPSGHTNVAMNSMLAFFLCSKNKKKSFWVFFIVAFMGFSRVYLIVHYLTDVIGGLIAGAIAGVLGYYFGKLLFSLIEKYKDTSFCKFILNADILNLAKKK